VKQCYRIRPSGLSAVTCTILHITCFFVKAANIRQSRQLLLAPVKQSKQRICLWHKSRHRLFYFPAPDKLSCCKLCAKCSYTTEWSRKNAQSLLHRHFANLCSSTRFSPKCSEKITIYQSPQNLYQFVK